MNSLVLKPFFLVARQHRQLLILYVILVVKQYIVTNKLSQCQTRQIFAGGAIDTIIRNRRLEEIIARKNNCIEKFKNRWNIMLDDSGDIWLR